HTHTHTHTHTHRDREKAETCLCFCSSLMCLKGMLRLTALWSGHCGKWRKVRNSLKSMLGLSIQTLQNFNPPLSPTNFSLPNTHTHTHTHTHTQHTHTHPSR